MGVPVHVNIEEIRKPEIDAQLIADNIAQQLEKRIMFRRAMKRAMQNAMRLGAQGIKIMSSGRLNGIEIARTEWYREGRVPLHTLRADLDYGTSEAKTTYGVIGIKVWVFKGEVIGRNDQSTGTGTQLLNQAPAPGGEPEGKRPPRKPASAPGRSGAGPRPAVRAESKNESKSEIRPADKKAERRTDGGEGSANTSAVGNTVKSGAKDAAAS
jgi:small subunit ribosomal protein S3